MAQSNNISCLHSVFTSLKRSKLCRIGPKCWFASSFVRKQDAAVRKKIIRLLESFGPGHPRSFSVSIAILISFFLPFPVEFKDCFQLFLVHAPYYSVYPFVCLLHHKLRLKLPVSLSIWIHLFLSVPLDFDNW